MKRTDDILIHVLDKEKKSVSKQRVALKLKVSINIFDRVCLLCENYMLSQNKNRDATVRFRSLPKRSRGAFLLLLCLFVLLW